MNTHDLAWAAGFFDGEGTTYLHRQNKYVNIRLSIGQKDGRVLDKWISIFQVGNIYCDDKSELYSWKIVGIENVQFVMCLIWSWLGEVKKEQYAKAMKQYLDNRSSTHVGFRKGGKRPHPARTHAVLIGE